MDIKEFKEKLVQGLYSFDHFEHPTGAFVQRYVGTPTYWIYQSKEGKRQTFYTADALMAHLITE